MLRFFGERTCAFDAEWVPCADTARRLLKLPDDTSEGEAMEAIWAHYARASESRPFLKLALCKVVSITAILRERDEAGRVTLTLASHGVDEMSEGELIRRFLEHVAGQQYQMWGYNSSGSDLPILIQRAVALGVPCPRFGKRPDKPWLGMDYFDARNSDAHMDILQLLSGNQRGAAMPSLDEFCAASGIPGKLDVDGGQVADLYLAGHIRRIVEYNETDALTTHLLMLRTGLHAGKLDAHAYAAELAAVRTLLNEQIAQGKPQFAKFQAAWADAPA